LGEEFGKAWRNGLKKAQPVSGREKAILVRAPKTKMLIDY
jgi:hypothetical protein